MGSEFYIILNLMVFTRLQSGGSLKARRGSYTEGLLTAFGTAGLEAMIVEWSRKANIYSHEQTC